MRALVIDTSTHRAEVALWEDGVCRARARNREPSKHAETLFGLIDGLFQPIGWRKTDVDVVIPCLGPGSFTGVRVGVAAAKGIAFALGKPIVGVSGLEAMAAALGEHSPALVLASDAIVALIDARKREVFWGTYTPGGEVVGGPGHIAIDRLGDMLASLPSKKVVVGEIADELPLAGHRVHRSEETDLPDVATLARLGVRALERRGPDDLDALEPIYLRPPDITLPKTK